MSQYKQFYDCIIQEEEQVLYFRRWVVFLILFQFIKDMIFLMLK